MSAFSYVSVLLSIVIALGIARLLDGVAEVIRHRREVAAKALYLWWCAFLLAVIGALALAGIIRGNTKWQLALVVAMSAAYVCFLILFRATISDSFP